MFARTGFSIVAMILGGLAFWTVLPCPALAAETGNAASDQADARAAAPDAIAERLYEVVEQPNLVYYDGADVSRNKHRLDLFTPRGKKGFPTVLFVHGGAWLIGDKSDFGMYAAIGRMLASHGIGAAVINYRLSPQVQHPEHVKDVARAFAWTHKNIEHHGGRPDRLFVCGHSAGGHLTALLCTDETWLKTEGLSLADVRGAMPISGVYAIPRGLFRSVFGADLDARRAASPINQVNAACPPFLIVYGDHDFPSCDLVSEAFSKALQGQGVSAETLIVRPRNHVDIIFKTRINDDPCARALRDFVFKHAE